MTPDPYHRVLSHRREVSPLSWSSCSGSQTMSSPTKTISNHPLLIDATNNWQSPSPDRDDSKYKNRMAGQVYMPPKLFLAFQRIRKSILIQNVRNAVRQFGTTKLCITACVRFKKVLILFLFLLAIQLSFTLHVLYLHCFGMHPIHGGRWGVKLDRLSIKYVIDKTYRRQQQELKMLGVVDLPQIPRISPTQLLQINTNAALRESLVRREKRSRTLVELENAAEGYERGCLKTHPDGFFPSILRHNTDSHNKRGIPTVVFVPDDPSWYARRPININSYETISFTEEEMRELIEDKYQPMVGTFDSLSTLEERARLWAVCALYFYGGIFWGNRKRHQILDFLVGRQSELFQSLNATTCNAPVGLAVFDRVRRAPYGHGDKPINDVEVVMLAATPRHPHLRCIMNQLETARSLNASQILSTFFFSNSFQASQTFQQFQGSETAVSHTWESLTTRCPYGHPHTWQECCRSVDLEVVESKLATEEIISSDPHGHIYVKVMQSNEPVAEHLNPQRLPIQVDIREREGTEAPVKSRKIALESLLQERSAEPGWLCTRCLKSPVFGTLEKCSPVCPSGYKDLLCRNDHDKSKVVMDLAIDQHESESEIESGKRIPRIIHQTWFEKLSPDRYPQLVRLQNSWRYSGWEYRFYTDETARQYIVDNFPSRFVDAFDSLIPGAYKADLFRYLVLLKDGGIYADVDIMLETTLDEFVTPSLSFFAARDVVGEFADEAFCLWNGLVGSAPGHPFLIAAVERVVNLILERADMYDMEREVCRKVGSSTESWKVRLEPLLLASGPCSLGIAVNDALNRSSLSKFDVGWVNYDFQTDRDYGDALILVGDKYDIGAFRLSDPERNLIIASTDLAGVDKAAREMSNPTRGEQRRRTLRTRPKPHYSEASRGSYVWGMHNVYKDDYVNNEIIKFDISYNNNK